MDLNKREEHVEKQDKLHMSLKESFAAMQKKREELLKENAKSVGEALKKSQKVHLKEEDTEEVKDEVKDDVAPAGDAPVADAAAPVADAVPAAPVEGGEVPAVAPVDGAPVTSQDQIATQDFVAEFMKGLPTELDLKASVDANGIFKANVNDQAEGQFVIVAFPASKNIHQVADLVEPLPVEPVAAPAGELASVPGGEVPPSDVSALDAGAAAMPPAPIEGAPVVPPVEGEEEKEEMKEEKEMCKEEEHCDDDMMGKLEEANQELVRDPIISGKKNWKTLLENREVARQKLLKEADEKKN